MLLIGLPLTILLGFSNRVGSTQPIRVQAYVRGDRLVCCPLSHKSPFIKHESPQTSDRGFSCIAGFVRILEIGQT
jgi:hypothetical protein